MPILSRLTTFQTTTAVGDQNSGTWTETCFSFLSQSPCKKISFLVRRECGGRVQRRVDELTTQPCGAGRTKKRIGWHKSALGIFTNRIVLTEQHTNAAAESYCVVVVVVVNACHSKPVVIIAGIRREKKHTPQNSVTFFFSPPPHSLDSLRWRKKRQAARENKERNAETSTRLARNGNKSSAGQRQENNNNKAKPKSVNLHLSRFLFFVLLGERTEGRHFFTHSYSKNSLSRRNPRRAYCFEFIRRATEWKKAKGINDGDDDD